MIKACNVFNVLSKPHTTIHCGVIFHNHYH